MAIGVGIVGCGNSARNIHYPRLSERPEQFKVLACCDLAEEKAREVADLYGAEPCTDLGTLLAREDIELVLVATKPPSTHAEIGMKALEAGKHVLLEKPMCASVEEGHRLIEAARRAEKVLTVYQCRRCDADFLCARWVIEQGLVGQLQFFETLVAGNLFGADWLFDWGVHLFDQALVVCSGRAVEVSCACAHPQSAEDASGPWQAFVRFDNGRIGLVSMPAGSSAEYPRFSIVGTAGALAWPLQQIEKKGDVLITRLPPIHMGREKGVSEPRQVSVPVQDFYQNLYEALTLGAEPMVKPGEGLAAVELALAAIQSAKEGKAVRL